MNITEPPKAINEKLNTKGKEKKRNKNKRKRQECASLQQLDSIDSWDWSEVKLADSMLISDDLGGFLCLEEISDVDIEYEGDENTGRLVKFKKVKSTKTKKSSRKCAEPENPLSIEESMKYGDLDNFNENLDLETKRLELIERAKVHDSFVREEGSNENNDDEFNYQPSEVFDENKNGQQYKHGKAMKFGVDNFDRSKFNLETRKDKTFNSSKKSLVNNHPSLNDIDLKFDISAWEQWGLCENILNSLRYQKFTKPTSIQEKVLPDALSGKDIIGVAETGSGKTLAFGIPIIQYLSQFTESSPEDDRLVALILTPTRELAIQVKDHLSQLSLFTHTKIITVVGGMSIQKQYRLLDRKPDVIVATPGRLWEILSEKDIYAERLSRIKFLVLDEADRMLDAGHFKELNFIFDILSRKRKATSDWPDMELSETTTNRFKEGRQTFVFTATLDESLRFTLKKKKSPLKTTSDLKNGTIADLIQRLDFTDLGPVIIDITSDKVVAASLLESKIECLQIEKDTYLYYFITRYPGRTLVFVNSIDSIRRLIPVFKLLQIEVLSLHAQMQQRQRLKNLDRFKQNAKAVLISSDVAARGLDIPLVDHVVHYQLPRSGEIYVHRSGRTARASKEGVSLILCAPEEMATYKKLCNVLNKGGYPNFPINHSIINELKARVNLARKIDQKEHEIQKANHDKNWFRQAAEDMEIELDDEFDDNETNSDESTKAKLIVKTWKHQLKIMLTKPVLEQGTSARYLTSGIVRDLAERLINVSGNETLPGQLMTRAVEDIKHKALKRQKRKI